MNTTANNVYNVTGGGGGAAAVCQFGGDLVTGAELTYSQAWTGIIGDGTFFGYTRHELGHSFGSDHFPGDSPEGSTIMSGNSRSKFSGDEVLSLESCFARVDLENFKSSKPATEMNDYEIPPIARLDKVLELDADGSANIDILLNDYDANGDDVVIKDFDAQSTLGGTITFVPAENSSSRDKLKYLAGSAVAQPDTCGDLCSSTDLLLWLDASDKTTIIDTDGKTGDDLSHLAAVQSWKDKSSHNNDATVYAATSHPELHLTGEKTISRQSVVRLESDLMEIRTLDLREATHPEITSIAVVRYDDGTPDNLPTLWASKYNGFNNRRHEAIAGTTVQTLFFDANEKSEWKNMLPRTTAAIAYDPAETGIALGAGLYAWDNYAGSYKATLTVAELLIFNRKLTTSERQHVESYLSKKWSITIKDKFNYVITDITGRTSQGVVYTPPHYETKPDLSAFDGKSVYLRNRKNCAEGDALCDWHLSWKGIPGEATLITSANTADLVPWKLTMVEGTTNQFYIANTWGCPVDSQCNHTLQFNELGQLNIVDSNEVMPFEISLVPGTDAPGITTEYAIRSKYQCASGHLRCNSSIGFNYDERVQLDIDFNAPVPWSIEVLP